MHALTARRSSLLHDINLGIAVDLDHNGLVVPVVRAAQKLTAVELAKAIRRQIDKAKAGKLLPDDLSGGTYSISNNGAFGTSFTAPIINAPQVAILSTNFDPAEASRGLDGRRRLRRAAHDRHGRTEL